MKPRARNVRQRGSVTHRHLADEELVVAGDAVLVDRGVLRSLVLSCPDACGEVLTINLDHRAGPAWRLYRGVDGLSLYPSVWRSSGCKSHFIVWRSRIFWCDLDEPFDDGDLSPEAVLAELGESFESYDAIAARMSAIPWEVMSACYRLARRGDAERGNGTQAHCYRRRRLRQSRELP